MSGMSVYCQGNLLNLVKMWLVVQRSLAIADSLAFYVLFLLCLWYAGKPI